MKIKQDFITNSSSTTFLIIPEDKHNYKKTVALCRYYCRHALGGKYPIIFKSLKKLISYTQGNDHTWIEEITRVPHEYFNLSQWEFELVRWFIEKHQKAVLYAYIDNDHGEKFESKLRNLGLDCLHYIGDDYVVHSSKHLDWTEFLLEFKERKRHG